MIPERNGMPGFSDVLRLYAGGRVWLPVKISGKPVFHDPFRFTLDQRQDIGEGSCLLRQEPPRCDPFCRKFLFLVADPSHRLQAAGKLVGGMEVSLEAISCSPERAARTPKAPAMAGFLDIRRRRPVIPQQRWHTFSSTERTLTWKPLADEGFSRTLPAAGQRFVAEGIQLGGVGVFADKGSAGVGRCPRTRRRPRLAVFFKGALPDPLANGLQRKVGASGR